MAAVTAAATACSTRAAVVDVCVAVVAIAALPAAWTVVARNEYRHHSLERLLRGKRRGVYALALAIFVASALRDAAFVRAMRSCQATPLSQLLSRLLLQPLSASSSSSSLLWQLSLPLLQRVTAHALVLAGSTLVVTAFARLGVTGTYLGDYFGYTLPSRVTSFPFSVSDNPMYVGATLNFAGMALRADSVVGVALTAWVALVYAVLVTRYERPFTARIYAHKAARDADAAAVAAAKRTDAQTPSPLLSS